MNQNRQDDEELAGGKTGNKSIFGYSNDISVGKRGQGRHQHGQYPEGQNQYRHNEGDEIDLQSTNLFQGHGAGCTGGDGEHTDGCEVDHKVGYPAERCCQDGKIIDEVMFFLDADQADAHCDAE